MATLRSSSHILVFPFPAQGHIIPLLDFTHRIALAATDIDLTITVLVTPKNLPFLTQLLAAHPRIQPLVLPFPPHPSIPSAVENLKDIPQRCLPALMHTLGQLYHPLLSWFQSHPSPPSAIVSDMFLGWTQRLASRVGAKHIVFSPSGAMALSILYSLWMELPRLDDPRDQTAVVSFDKLPNCPKYPWWKISGLYRACVEGDPAMEFIKDIFHANIQSWGLVVNSFNQLERPYFDHLKRMMGCDRVWAVGPLLPLHDHDDLTVAVHKGGSSSVPLDHLLTWLDACEDGEVVYVCFGSQVVLTNDQMAGVASGLEKSGVRFIWSIKEPSVGHVEANYGMIPNGFEERVANNGLVIRGWAPQVAILKLKVGKKACEGPQTVPNPEELARVLAESVSREKGVERKGVMELRKAALEAVREGGSSAQDMEEMVLEWKLEKMLKGNERDYDQYLYLMSLCAKIRNASRAMHVFTSMEVHGIKPTTSLFNSLIHACLSSKDSITALSLFEIMQSSEDYKPNDETYETFIIGFSSLGNTDAMKSWYSAKKAAGYCATLQTYESLVSGCIKARDFNGADRFYDEIKSTGIMTSETILENLLEGFCRRRRFNQEISVKMVEKVVGLYSEHGKVEEMEELLSTVVESGQAVTVLSRVNSGIIRMYATLNRLDDVEYSVGRMLKQGLSFRCADDVEKVICCYFRGIGELGFLRD
ncbi:hypothetical protein ES332_D03G124300v1 [Gossypium tomentosum]|uniref:PROP1-like PPR domain-containing protein n=1 Tax=Gossypium tomentosum TaxID=34277 RepID=A0A5D2LP04_GOSTO|nr:hypothetical protein ES332_D03G124300v1 [Gossypium tomentosum]